MEIATKVGQQDGPPERKMGLSRRWMLQAIDASLKRLGTDYVDIYYMHHRDRDTPLIESIEAMRDIIASGKASYWGFSNYYGWEIGEIVRLCDKTGTPRPVVAQPLYNIVMRMIENDYLPACAHYGIGVAPFSPLARGALTGKYKEGGEPPAGSRAARGDNSLLTRDFSKQTFQVVEALRAYVAKRGMTPADFAVLWVLNNRTISSVIAGPRTLGVEGLSRRSGAQVHRRGREIRRYARRIGPSGDAGADLVAASAHGPQADRELMARSSIVALQRTKDGLVYPFAEAPELGKTIEVAPGILWARIPLPFGSIM